MNPLATTDELFFTQSGLDRGRVEHLTQEALNGADDGEMYPGIQPVGGAELRRRQAEERQLRHHPGLRPAGGEGRGRRLCPCQRAVGRGDAPGRDHREGGPWRAGRQAGRGAAPAPTAGSMSRTTPSAAVDFAVKTKLLGEIDAYVRAKDPRVRQVMVSLSGSWQAIQILRGEGHRAADIRPLVRLNVSVVVEENGRMETGSHGTGGRTGYDLYLQPEHWRARGRRGVSPGPGQSRLRPGPGRRDGGRARARAGRASCCMRPSAMGWRAISTARRPAPSPGCSASGSPPRA